MRGTLKCQPGNRRTARCQPETCDRGHCGSLAGLFVLTCLVLGRTLSADERATVPRPAATLDVDRIAVNRIATVREYLRVQEWKPAVELLRPLMAEHGDSLYRVSPGRWMNVRAYCHVLISRMPAVGLQVYRHQVDTRARQLFETGRLRGNDDVLRQVVRDAFCSSYGDDSLLLLADRAWERGEFAIACQNWQRLLPAEEPTSQTVLRYPDPAIPEAQVRARLVLCQLALGQIDNARRQYAEFQVHHPDAVGTLGGRAGKLVDALETLIAEPDHWPARRGLPVEDAFAGNRKRDRIERIPANVGRVAWQIRLPNAGGFSGTHPLQLPHRNAGVRGLPPLVFPVVAGGRLFACDAKRIFGWDLRTGRPAWWADDLPLGENAEQRLRQATIFPATDVAEPLPLPRRPVLGTPRYSLTVVDDRLFARMGLPVTVRAADELQVFPSQLVCLDLGQGQGKVLWTCSADAVERQWAFEGAPIVVGSYLYVLFRKMQVESQLNVVCIEAQTGRPIWNQPVCAALLPRAQNSNLVSQLLLTVGGAHLFVSTQLGAIAALNRFDGVPEWVVSYPRTDGAPRRSVARPPSPPCVFHDNLVVVAPRDARSVMAIDSATGIVRWQTEVPDRIDAVLGVGHGRVIVSGQSLWGLDLLTGATIWGSRHHDPEYDGFGRGLLVADAVWWPRRHVIEIRSQATGQPLRQPINLTHRGARSGNLLIRDGVLVVTSRDQLTVFAPQPAPRRTKQRLLSLRRWNRQSSDERDRPRRPNHAP